MPLDEVLSIALQLVEALEAAHSSGIVHRDLKPANVKTRSDGAIKVLDFGIATLLATPDAIGNAPTTPAATRPGEAIGTPAYMAPEQARGETVDRRADIWAFGVLVLEMITGRSPFARANTADTVVAVLKEEPALEGVPPALHRLLRACLEKDPRRRLRDIGDARLLTDEGGDAPAPAARWTWLPWGVAAASLVAAVAAMTAGRGPAAPPPAPQVLRFQLDPAANPVASGVSAISPDGRHFAYMGTGADGAQRLWVRDLDSLDDRPLAGTEVVGAVPPIFWSPDSRFIAYDAGGRLRKVDREGGLPITICEVGVPIIGGTWNRKGVILFSAIGQNLLQVSDQGGTPTPLSWVNVEPGSGALMPVFLQDGNRFLFLRANQKDASLNAIFASALEGDAAAKTPRRILTTATNVSYAPDGPGRGQLLFLRNQEELMAQQLDETTLELTGQPRPIARGVHSYLDGVSVSASNDDTLVYRNALPLQLVWLDRSGHLVSRGSDSGPYETLTLSPDGTRALVSEANRLSSNDTNSWLIDFTKGTKTKLVDANARHAVWSPEATRVVFASSSSLSLLQLGAGAPTALLSLPGDRVYPVSPTSWSADGQLLLYTLSKPKIGADIWVLPVEKPAEARVLVSAAGSEMQAQFSPEPGRPRWFAYTANGSGREEVFVRGFDESGLGQLVSSDGGHSPQWRGDGRELYYVSPQGQLKAVAFPKDQARPGTPAKLFDVPAGFGSRDATDLRAPAPWGVTPDGQRFVFAVPAEASARAAFTVILNWPAAQSR
jgi:Tol biopolymer transport system component